MKSVVSKFIATYLLLAPAPRALWAQVATNPPSDPHALNESAPPTEADQALETLRAENRLAEVEKPDGAGRSWTRAEIAAHGKSAAERARNFYTKYPAHSQAAEARKLEVFSLIQAVENGDEAPQLDGLVDSLRKDPAAPVKTRAQVAAAYDFTQALRLLKSDGDRMDATVSVARRLAQEFPDEPQAYEALLAVARASTREKSEQLAREIVGSMAPESLKSAAQTLLDRYGLVGRNLAAVIGEDGATLVAALPPATPAIIYSWATWGPGSIELGRMIQARRFAAIGVCLDENTDEARIAEHRAGLGGKHAYDPKGLAGSLANRLKFSTAGQIYLVDAGGVIRDVRGGEELEAKLKTLGFSTPALVVPSIAELLRQ